MRPRYKTIQEMIVATSEAVRPRERLSVSESTEKYRIINNPGVYTGPWRNKTAPYLREPMDELGSDELTGMIFVGPAQTGKTEMFPNWLNHTAICDPADMMLYQMSQMAARDFSIRRIDRFYRQNPQIESRILPGRHNRGIYMTKFTSGMLLTVSWPSITEMSGKPIPRLWLTDYDRMPESVDGEGSPYDLARKRATTFGRRAMCVAESSPGWEIDEPRWIPRSPHEAPPTKGILALYNRGDRRRWYWRCYGCAKAYEPDFSLLHYNTKTEDVLDAAEQAFLACPHCGFIVKHNGDKELGTPGKAEMNYEMARWVKDNQKWEPDPKYLDFPGKITGKASRSEIGSFWLKGVVASFTDWKTLVFNYLKATKEFIDTGSQEALKTTVTTDQGLPYLPRGNELSRLPEDLKDQASPIKQGYVPKGTRYLIATIDVQKNRFVVQVHGFGVKGDVWIIDRFDVKMSKRIDPDTKEHFWLSPAGYLEDWFELIPKVLTRDFPLDDDSGRMMKIRAIGCDSGGREGVTKNAYDFWRFLKDGPMENETPPEGWTEGLHRRFQLLKGIPTNLAAPRVQIAFPDTERKDRKAGARGEIPVLLMNSNMLKDQLNAMLDRKEEDGGKVTLPKWFSDSHFTELVAETRGPKGWENEKKLRNETWDLLYYALAVSLCRLVRQELIDWDKPPSWADVWEKNDLVYKPAPTGQGQGRFVEKVKSDYDLTSLGELLG